MNDPVLTQALAVLDTADVAANDDAGCTDLLGAIRKVRSWVDAVEARVTTRMRELHATAGAAPAADLHTRCGGVSSAEGKRKERRSEAIDQAPSFRDALADGAIGAEHVDASANATAKLDDEIREALFGFEDELLDDATHMTPERFSRACRDRARRLERDQGIERNRRQRKQTFLSRKLNPATGMVEGRFAFHPELAEQVFGAVDREVAAMVIAPPPPAGSTTTRSARPEPTWDLGGVTDLHNLLPVCSRHHHAVHELGWRLDLSPDRTLTVTDRHGSTLFVGTPDRLHRQRRTRRPAA